MSEAPVIKIGHDKDALNNASILADSICAVVDACHAAHMDQETTRHALDVFKESVSINNISISSCNFEVD